MFKRQTMSFPPNEYKAIEDALINHGHCWTCRVENEYKKYKLNEVVFSHFGLLIITQLVRNTKDLASDPDVWNDIKDHPTWVKQIKGKPGDHIEFKLYVDMKI